MMKYSLILAVFVMIGISQLNAQSNNNFEFVINGGYSIALPENDYDLFKYGCKVGFELLYGRKFKYGLSFSYLKFIEEEQILTDETGSKPLGRFTPNAKGQFYALSAKYRLMGKGKISPFIQTKIGFVHRYIDLKFGKDGFKDYHFNDKNRLACSIVAGVEVPISSSIKVISSLDYFRTQKVTDKGWKYEFNSILSDYSMNVGIGISF
jgi:opacity protein-like surface antigen